MDVARLVAALRDSGERLDRAAAAAGLEAPIPTCPDWTVADLLRHVTGVHRWATWHLTAGADRPTTGDENAGLFASRPDHELLDGYREGLAALVEALSHAAPTLACWSFLPAPSPLAFWARRQAHETSIHCVDAEAAAGRTSSSPADLALDGIDELLTGFLARPRGRLVADPPYTLAIVPDEDEVGWTIEVRANGRTVTRGTNHPDCTLTGAAGDLYRLLWNRAVPGPATPAEGDLRVLAHWRAHATIR